MSPKLMKISFGLVKEKELKSDVLVNYMMAYFAWLWYTELVKTVSMEARAATPTLTARKCLVKRCAENARQYFLPEENSSLMGAKACSLLLNWYFLN